MPWEIARYDLSNDLEKNKIKTIDIINFANKESKKNLLLSLKNLFLWIVGKCQHAHKTYKIKLNMNVEEITTSWKKSINFYIPYEQNRILLG
jgi:hypothetical protein